MSPTERVLEVFKTVGRSPRLSFRYLLRMPLQLRGYHYGHTWSADLVPAGHCEGAEVPNALRTFFESNQEGPGIFKWTHYFDIYERHFSKFLGKTVHVMEVGIYSGGSLRMWRSYFGRNCSVYGVDIEEACKAYADGSTRIFIGDQQDRDFWERVKAEVPPLDILIDDGGHRAEQQIATLEAMLPHLRPGGVYLCEDLHGELNEFNAYVQALTSNLHAFRWPPGASLLASRATSFQNTISGVHFYPYVTVIEKSIKPVSEFVAPKHGTEWQPSL
jgi:23S rRNA U2552 (ribose-2'-O)-methylase RlmE/FtsJ